VRKEAHLRSGWWIKQLSGDAEYKAFIPNKLPYVGSLQFDDSILDLLSKASILLGRLDGITELLPDPDFFVLMYIKKEATSSAQIEGTQATFADLLKHEAGVSDPAIPDDVKEIVNYIKAMNYGVQRLSTLPLSLRLIREIHRILLAGTRGQGKNPGEFRKSQNWVGGRTINLATYVPPPAHEMVGLLGNFEEFLHQKIRMPIIIKAALIHAQFELIHPFLDGNGRTGRLLIAFYLYHEKVLKRPLLFLSDYFRRFRQEYYDRLNSISKRDELEGWLKYFLDGVINVSENATTLSQKIIELRKEDEEKIINLGKAAKSGIKLLNYLYSNPIVSGNLTEKITGLSPSNARNVIGRFIKLNILKQADKRQREKRYIYERYVKLFTAE
jgi:Fic family protein